ncbi:MAG: hypothetical protein AB7D00_02560 [Rhodospirillaceae bacterium]
MRRGGKIGVAVAALGVLAFGGFKAFEHVAEGKARARLDAQLAELGLTESVRYGAVTVSPLSRGVTVADMAYSEEGAVVWRIDRVEMADLAEDSQGLLRDAVVGVRGVHLSFAQWSKDCAEKGASCAYAANAQEMLDNGIEELLVDLDFAYHMDDAARRLRLAGGLTLRNYVAFSTKLTVGGLSAATLRDVGAWGRDALQSGVPPILAIALFGQTAGKTIEKVELGDFGFTMTDLGGVRRHAEIHAKDTGDARPVDEIVREQVTAVQADIRAGAEPWMPAEFTEAMAKALEPFAYQGKPLRIRTTAAQPLLLLQRGPVGLQAGPDLADPARLFQALAPKVDNAPL